MSTVFSKLLRNGFNWPLTPPATPFDNYVDLDFADYVAAVYRIRAWTGDIAITSYLDPGLPSIQGTWQAAPTQPTPSTLVDEISLLYQPNLGPGVALEISGATSMSVVTEDQAGLPPDEQMHTTVRAAKLGTDSGLDYYATGGNLQILWDLTKSYRLPSGKIRVPIDATYSSLYLFGFFLVGGYADFRVGTTFHLPAGLQISGQSVVLKTPDTGVLDCAANLTPGVYWIYGGRWSETTGQFQGPI